MDTFDEKTQTMVYSDGSGRVAIEVGFGPMRYSRWLRKHTIPFHDLALTNPSAYNQFI